MREKRGRSGEAASQSDNNTDPDLSAQAHKPHPLHVEMHSITKHRRLRLYKHESMGIILV